MSNTKTLAGGALNLAAQLKNYYPDGGSAAVAPKPGHVQKIICASCSDTGFYIPEMEVGERGFGRAIRCSCGGPKRSSAELANASGVLPAHTHYDLDFFSGKAGKWTAAAAIKGGLKAGCKLFYLYGSYGVGKSGLLISAVNAGCEMGLKSVYSDMPQILQYEREQFGDRDDDTQAKREEKRRIGRLQHAKVLAIDELDKCSDTPFTREKIFSLLNDRYNRRHDRVTILASNTAPKDLPKHLGWLQSRFEDAIVLHVAGDHLRGNK